MYKAFFFLLLFFVSAHSQEQYTIYFDVDKDVATATSAEKFQQWIEDNKTCSVTKIIGYADSTGTSAYNLPLSERRANYARKQLKAHNLIISEDAEIKGLGETKVFSDNLSSDRIAVIYYKPAEEPKPKSKLDAAVKNAHIGDKLKLENLNFYGDSGIPLPESKSVLADLLNIMKDNPTLQIEIQGHICCSYNDSKGVSEMRIKTVYDYLINNGIDEMRLHYRSFGSTRPIYPLPEKNEQERIANRRVEIEILAK